MKREKNTLFSPRAIFIHLYLKIFICAISRFDMWSEDKEPYVLFDIIHVR